jgi:hypothetical protein
MCGAAIIIAGRRAGTAVISTGTITAIGTRSRSTISRTASTAIVIIAVGSRVSGGNQEKRSIKRNGRSADLGFTRDRQCKITKSGLPGLVKGARFTISAAFAFACAPQQKYWAQQLVNRESDQQ